MEKFENYRPASSLFECCAHCLFSWKVETVLTCGLQEKIVRHKLKRKKVEPGYVCDEWEEDVPE